MLYFYEPYTKPLPVDTERFTFKKLSEISFLDRDVLAKIYCTLFNQDNKLLIKELGITGKSTEVGIWNEKPYFLPTCKDVINDYVTDKYFGVCAYGVVGGKRVPLGACVYQLRDLDNLKSKGYALPFNIPDNSEIWCAIDTFRVDLVFNGKSVKGLANEMRDYVDKLFKEKNPVLLYSSTNNPIMVKSWRKYGFTIVEKETTFGNKFQAFKLV